MRLISISADYWAERLDAAREFLRTALKSGLFSVLLLLFFTLFVSGFILLIIEGKEGTFKNLFDAIWYGWISMTTTGYGDFIPRTTTGKWIGMIVILCGFVLMSFFTATVSSLFVAAKIREGKGLEQIHFRDHIVVCGYGPPTTKLFESLISQSGSQHLRVVLVADIPGNEVGELINRYSKVNLRFVRGDWSHESVLKRAGVPAAKVVIIMPDLTQPTTAQMDEKTVLATLTAKALNPKARVFVHIMRPENRVFLKHAQADEVLVSDELSGYLLAAYAISSGLPQAINEMLSPFGVNRLMRNTIPNEFIGKTFGDLAKYFFERNAILIGLTCEEEPLKTTDLLTHDTSALDEFIRRKFQEAGLSQQDKLRVKTRLNPPRNTIIHRGDIALIISGESDL